MSTQLKDKLVTLEILKMVTDSLHGDENIQLPSINGGKIQIDFDGSKFRYEENELNYKQLHDYHLNTPNFTFVVYGDRAYLLSYDQADSSSMREMRFQSVLAVTDSNGINLVKTSGIYVTSTDGINISSVRITDINSENESYKVDEITSENKNSSVFYPSAKAMVDYVNDNLPNDLEQLEKDVSDLKEDLRSKLDKETADTLYAPIGSNGGQGGSGVPSAFISAIQELFNAVAVWDSNKISNPTAKISALSAFAGSGGDTPSEPVEGGISVSWSGTVATINNLKNLTVSYSGNVATVGV